MAQENFNVSQPNDGLGDKLRAAFIKAQSNFTDLFTNKVDKEAGKGLSNENYTTTEKNKLSNIEDFAEVNVQADFLQNDSTADDFIKNKPAIPVVADYLLNGGYTGTAQDLEDAIEAGGQLIKVTENNQTGYRLKDANPANYGNIGQDAVDLSISDSASTTKGATGDFSHAEGVSTIASGFSSHAEGNDTIASGSASHAEGSSTTASGDASHAEGFGTIASGRLSHAEGSSTFARSIAEHAGGMFGTDYAPINAFDFNLADRLVNYGNGTDGNNRRDAYTLFKNGMQKFFTAALSTITNATKGSVMLDENARMNIHDGTAFKAVAFIQDIGVSNSKNLGPTGLNQGGLLTINTDAAKFDLSAGFGYIVNGHSDPDNPTYTKVTWVAKIANTIPNLATQKQTYVAIDINGDLYFTNVPLTATQRRNFIRIGVLIHLNNSAVTYIDNQPTINIEIGGQVQDILEALGFKSLSGNRIFPVSNNLKIKKELGRVFKPGANFNNLTTQPHSFTLAAQEPITFRYRTQTGSEGSDITDITPAIYDLNGTITPVAATATLATIQRVYIFQDGVIRIQPGQRVFTTLNAAITALNSDVFITDLDIAENGLYLGAIVLTRNTVDLSNISQAIFAPSIGTTANGSVASPALAYTAEDVANKQNSLAVDGTGAKYPTVDAVNARLSGLLPSPLLGNVLRGNGTAYAAISEDLFQRANKTLNKIHPSRLSSWDDFITADGELNGRVSPSGHTWLVVNRLTNAQINGEYTVSNWRAEKTSISEDIVALIPIPSTNGLKTEVLTGFTSGNTTLISLNYYFNGDFLTFTFNGVFVISKIVAGVSTILLSENVANFQFPLGDNNQRYQEKITANISNTGSVASISITMNAFNRAYSTSDTDFQRILQGATHVGIRGSRSGIISAIKNTTI